ncbi:prepilin-type N-terminal cleavage/methylation domain-containing protein [Sporohalobacter salinus]|uniref:prepilin-type N-terminal cleavage/methylation domain-containing protein n=1 Tax=Sporohalobacter salinus TaxID=1494606 RepID=UPI00195F9A24|nr:prepilin-type N-terminal cleavage/methylation domain-containing protein [Sporohalobacter salinus]
MVFKFNWQQERGMTLIEVLVGITILAVILISILGYFVRSTKVVSETEKRSIALNLAQKKMEELKGMEFDNLSEEDEDYGDIDDYPEFKREVDLELEESNLQGVTVIVSWQSGDSENSIRLETYIARR